MNIIPYLGPLIGGAIGISLGIISTLAGGSYNEILPLILKLLGTFIVANFIDNNILIPVIYSRSVKSHPLEIFLIIIIGGGIAGIVGCYLPYPYIHYLEYCKGVFPAVQSGTKNYGTNGSGRPG
jgi:predicted PurR-regulated permease PerM